MFKKLLVLFFIFLGGLLQATAAVTFKVNAPAAVSAGERFRVEFVVSGDQGGSFVEPTFSGCEVLAGPTVSTSFQTVIRGSQTTTVNSQKYTYVLVSQDGQSKIRVSSASITVAGQKYNTKAVVVDVVAARSSVRSSAGSSAVSSVGADDVMLRMEVDRKELYKGDVLVATLRVYARVDVVGFQDIKYPSFNGFWAQELEVPNGEAQQVVIGGKNYISQVMRQWLLYPQRAGWLTVEQSDLTAMVQVVTRSKPTGFSLYDDIIGSMPDVQIVKKPLMAPPTKIFVKELPLPEPQGFTGAVGQFKMSVVVGGGSGASSDGSGAGVRIAANSAEVLKVTIMGKGNFTLIDRPQLAFPTTFETYDAKVNDNIQYSIRGAVGTRIWEYPFIARAQGQFAVPDGGVKFVFFDPTAAKYVELSSAAVPVAVTPDAGGGAAVGGDFQMLGQDVKFLKLGAPGFVQRDGYLLWSGLFWGLTLGVVAAFLVAFYLLRRMVVLRGDVALMRNRRASKVALTRLRGVRTLVAGSDAGQRDEFFREMLRAMWGYLQDKYALDAAMLTKDNVRATLEAAGVQVPVVEAVISLIDSCEMAQYSTAVDLSREDVYADALRLIDQLEQLQKNVKK